MESLAIEKFDFTRKEELLRAYELAASHAINQSIPIVNIKGVLAAATGARLLAELELRYQAFKHKARKDGFVPLVLLLESTPQPTD